MAINLTWQRYASIGPKRGTGGTIRLDLARRLVFGQNGFIYCVPGHKVIKHMPMFWSDAMPAVVVFGTTTGDALCGAGEDGRGERDAPSGVR